MILRVLAKLRAIVYSALRIRTIGATVLAIDDDERVLLIRQTYGSSAWRFPGGGVQRTETVKAAALREAREECGLRMRPDGTVDLLGVYLKRIGNWQDQVCVLVVRGWDLEPSASSEVSAVERFDQHDLPQPLSGAVARRLAEWRGEAPVSEDW